MLVVVTGEPAEKATPEPRPKWHPRSTMGGRGPDVRDKGDRRRSSESCGS